ncbi:MAG: glycosyltransferase family 39 protein [candidate division WOR-3 bacterium]
MNAAAPCTKTDRFLPAYSRLAANRTALLILILGLLVRLGLAALLQLNPDEVIRVLAADRPSLAEVFRHDLDNPHPPLLSILLFGWRILGRGDFVLRLLPVVSSGATLWLVYRWLSNRFGETTGLTGLALLSFLPSMVVPGFEIRPYAVELLGIAGALYTLDAGLHRQNPALLLLAGLLQALALASHYSALIFIAAAGAYGLISLLRLHLPRRLTLAWMFGQVVTLGTLVLLYFVHIRRLIGGQRETILREEYLRNLYYSPDKGSLIRFLASRTFDLFRYIAADPRGVVAALFLLLFIVGVILLWRKLRWQEGLLILAPFLIAMFIAALGRYPLGGTRHLVLLIIFGVAGVAFALSRLIPKRLLLLAGTIAMPLWLVLGGWMIMGGYVNPLVFRSSHIRSAVREVRQRTRLGDIVFSDLQTQLLLKRYLWNNRGPVQARYPKGLFDYKVSGYRLVSIHDWRFVPSRFGHDFRLLTETYGLATGTPVTVVSSEYFYPHLADELERRGFAPEAVRTFGPRIAVFTCRAGNEPADDSGRQHTALLRQSLDSLLGVAEQRLGGTAAATIWPGRFLDIPARKRLSALAGAVFSYAELTETLEQNPDRMLDFLPALAFRIYRTTELTHPCLLLRPAEQSYLVYGVRVTLVAQSADSTVGVYLLDTPVPRGLASLVRGLDPELAEMSRIILWPARFGTLAQELLSGRYNRPIVPYCVLKRALEQGECNIESALPALAFWELGTYEPAPVFMTVMNQLSDTTVDGVQIRLLKADVANGVGLFMLIPDTR